MLGGVTERSLRLFTANNSTKGAAGTRQTAPIFIDRGAPLGYSEGLAGVGGFKQDSRSHAASL
jgi:hypothetical protein